MATVQLGHDVRAYKITEEFKIKKGARQGCVLSPNLFNLYTEKIFREVKDMKGVVIGGVNINNLRYADDTAMITENTDDLQELLEAVNKAGKPYGMEMNVKKNKINGSDQAPTSTKN